MKSNDSSIKTPFAKETIRLLRQGYPGIEKNAHYLLMLRNWIKWGCTRIDRDTSLPFFQHHEIRDTFGYKRNINTGRLLSRFQADVLPEMEWSKSSYNSEEGRGKCRQIENIGLDIGYYIRPNDIIIDIRSGRAISGNERTKNYQHAKAQALCNQWIYPDQKLIADYHTSQAFTPYLACIDRFHTVRNAAIEEGYQIWLQADTRQKQSHAYSTVLKLDSILACPMPFYATAREEGSLCPRLFSSNSLQGLPKRYRKMLFPEWVDLDLRSAHVAIITGLWGCQGLRDFILGDKTIWQELGNYFGLYVQGEIKAAMKKALFSLLYGKQAHRVQAELKKDLASLNITVKKQLKDCPTVALLLSVLDRARQSIQEHGGAIGAYGFIPLNKCKDIKSLLCIQVQSYELALIASLYHYAENCKKAHKASDFIKLYSFDGISIERGTNVAALQEVIRAKGKEFDMVMALEVE